MPSLRTQQRLSVGTLVVGGVACHLGAHGGGCSVPSYGTGQHDGGTILFLRVIMHASMHIVFVWSWL